MKLLLLLLRTFLKKGSTVPRATVNLNPERFELFSCPEGFVTLKRMSYAQWIRRQDIAMRMELEGASNPKDATSTIEMTQQRVAFWEFEQCVVDHNLENENGTNLNFKSPEALQVLDPRIGTEISKYITELHDFDLGK